MEGELYVPQKMLPASMLQELQDTAILLCDGISSSLKFQWAVLLSQSISRYRPAERSGVRFGRLVVCGPSSSKLGPLFSAGKGAVELDAICQPGD